MEYQFYESFYLRGRRNWLTFDQFSKLIRFNNIYVNYSKIGHFIVWKWQGELIKP